MKSTKCQLCCPIVQINIEYYMNVNCDWNLLRHKKNRCLKIDCHGFSRVFVCLPYVNSHPTALSFTAGFGYTQVPVSYEKRTERRREKKTETNIHWQQYSTHAHDVFISSFTFRVLQYKINVGFFQPNEIFKQILLGYVEVKAKMFAYKTMNYSEYAIQIFVNVTQTQPNNMKHWLLYWIRCPLGMDISWLLQTLRK